MIEQLNTIRDFIESAYTTNWPRVEDRNAAHDAIEQLEAMVGAQEPKFWYRPVGNDGLYEGPVHHNSIGGKMLRDEKPGEWVPLFEGAAPVAQQPTFDARRALEAIEALLSNIRRDAPSLSGKVMGFAEEVAAALRDKVARQPQARPDFTDEWAGYLKDGETPFERFLRERKDLNALTKLYQRALEENERLKAQQPQAEAVPGLGEFLADLNRSRTKYPNNARMWDGLMGEVNELRRAYHGDGDQRAEAFDVAVCAYRIATEGDAGGNTLFAAPQQAEAVPKFVWGYAVRNPKEPGVPHSLAYSKVQADTQALQLYRAEIIPLVAAAPQQAEAAPSDVARDAAPIPDHELVTMYDERPTSDLEMIEFAREVERRHGIGVQPQHITDGSPCWCNPDVAYTDPETGASVIVHRRPQ